jgi:hypothetical protein
MAESIRVWLKKVFSLSLVLNSLITLAAIAGMYGFCQSLSTWKPFTPYLINGNLFLLVAVAALINIFPTASIGRALHTGRFLFHHYVNGAFVLVSSYVLVFFSTSLSVIDLFLMNTANVGINAGKFFVLTGLTLFIDDLPDVSKRVESSLNRIKSGFCKVRKVVHVLQLVTGLVTFYAFIAIAMWSIQHNLLTAPNVLSMSTFLITSITAFACVKRKAWLKVTPP